jgi:hypothetical protein
MAERMSWLEHQRRLQEEVYQLEDLPALDDAVLCLYYLSKHSLLPELHEVLGPQKLLDLIAVFGGTTVTFPTVEQFRQAVIDIALYRDLGEFLGDPRCVDAHEAAEKAKRKYNVTDPWQRVRRVVSVLTPDKEIAMLTPTADDVVITCETAEEAKRVQERYEQDGWACKVLSPGSGGLYTVRVARKGAPVVTEVNVCPSAQE